MVTVRDLLDRIRPISSPWRTCAAGFGRSPLTAAVTESLPSEYRALMGTLGPGEGFIAARFLRLYPLDELVSANVA